MWNFIWYDSSMGDVIMSNLFLVIMIGWIVIVYIVFVILWICVFENMIDSIMFFK